MIGTHKVMAYGDPAAADWVPLASNPGFDASAAGWRGTPWSTAWTWITGGFLSANSPTAYVQGLDRDPATGAIARPANVAEYRVRVKFTIVGRARAFWKVQGGNTAQAAYDPVQESLQAWTWEYLPAGTYEFESTWPDTFSSAIQFIAPHFHVGPTPEGPCVVDYLDLSYRSNAGSADITCWVDELSIQHGRSDSTAQPEASACTLDFTTTPENPLPSVVDVGAVITVTTRLPATPETPLVDSVRFTGRISDLHYGWDDAGEETPDAGIGQATAVSVLADLGRRNVGAEPFPQELDGARVARVMTLAGVTLNPAYSDPGTVQILPRDVDTQPALGVSQDVAESAGGLVWQTRAGEVRYADAEHRRGVAPLLLLDSCDVLVSPVWQRNLDGLVNEISIGYGAEPAGGGEQPRYVAANDPSRVKWGRFAVSRTTELAALADAQAMANLLLVRNGTPAWVMAALPVDVEGLSAGDTAALLQSEMHDLIQLTGMPKIGNAPTIGSFWLEGWTERLSYGVHEIELAVSSYCRTSAPPRWNDLQSSMTWDTTDPAMTWNDAHCLGPVPPTDQWDSVPASIRWDAVPASVTWDTYKPLATSEG